MSPALDVIQTEKFATFGELLKYARRRAGLTQLELTIDLGMLRRAVPRSATTAANLMAGSAGRSRLGTPR